MNPYTVGPLFALLALLQSTVTSHWRLLGASPDLVLVMTVICVLLWGVRASLPAILAGGLVIDILTGAPFGIAVASLVAVSLLVGAGAVNIPGRAHFWPYVAIVASTLIYQVLWMLTLRLAGHSVPWVPMFVRDVLPSVVVNTVTLAVLYAVARLIWGRPQPETVG